VSRTPNPKKSGKRRRKRRRGRKIRREEKGDGGIPGGSV
jgi:hypothetical protein